MKTDEHTARLQVEIESYDSKIAKLKKKREEITREIELAEVRSSAFKHAISIISGRRYAEPSAAQDTPTRSSNAFVKVTSKQGVGKLSNVWLEILKFIGNQERSIDDIFQFSEQRGYALKRQNIRTQMSLNKTRRNYVSSVKPGIYTLTDVGKNVCGIDRVFSPDDPPSRENNIPLFNVADADRIDK